jgi:hypothetical protein
MHSTSLNKADFTGLYPCQPDTLPLIMMQCIIIYMKRYLWMAFWMMMEYFGGYQNPFEDWFHVWVTFPIVGLTALSFLLTLPNRLRRIVA